MTAVLKLICVSLSVHMCLFTCLYTCSLAKLLSIRWREKKNRRILKIRTMSILNHLLCLTSLVKDRSGFKELRLKVELCRHPPALTFSSQKFHQSAENLLCTFNLLAWKNIN